MIQSLFIITSTGEVIIEKHWRGVIQRVVCDFFFEEVHKYDNKEDVPPILSTSKYYLINVHKDGLYFLAVTMAEVPPLMVIELLHRILDVFRDYFGSVTETSLKDNFSTVYQLLEEMIDHGYPFTTEPNALMAMIAPPSTSSRLAAMVSGKSGISEVLPDGTISNIPWRKANAKYTQNEIYFDIIEEIDAIVDAFGRMVSCEVGGMIMCNCRLSGVPDLTMVFTDPTVLDDCSFHPCVRYSRYEKERVVSFIPPDGDFKLMDYRVQVQRLVPPLYCQPSIKYDNNGGGTLEIIVGPKQMPTLSTNSKRSVLVEDIVVSIPFPKAVRTVQMNVTVGSALFDEKTKVAKWTIGKLQPAKQPILTGTITLNNTTKAPEERPNILLEFKVPMASVSGLGVETLVVSNERYKPYKGVRTLAKSGRFQVRT